MPDPQQHPVLRYLRQVVAAPPGEGVADAELLRRFVAGRDEAAFELLLWRHAGMVLRVCRAVLRDAHAAEDAFQATFLALARKAASVGREAVAGWLYRVASHAALKARARAARRAACEAAAGSRSAVCVAAGPGEAAERRELAPLLQEEVRRLPARYRTPVVLCYLEGRTHEEAARELGWPRGTVAGRLARARDLLRRRLARRGVALTAAAAAAALAEGAAAAAPAALAEATARAALAFAAGGGAGLVSAPVLQLTHGVLHAMFVSKVKSAALACLAVVLLVGGAQAVRVWADPQEPQEPQAPDPGREYRAEPPPPPAQPARPPRDPEATVRGVARSDPNLRNIGIAIHNYAAENGHLPADIVNPKDGRPVLSWRVAILPYLQGDNLFKQFRPDEPWDGPRNKKLLAEMPSAYRVEAQPRDAAETYYQGFAGPGTLFDPKRRAPFFRRGPEGGGDYDGAGGKAAPRGIRLSDVTDGTSNTLLVVEAGRPVPWTKPEDLPYDPDKPLPRLGGAFPGIIHALFADGSVHTLRGDFDEKAMRAAVTYAGGEVFRMEGLEAPRGKRPDPDRLRSDNARFEEALRDTVEEARKLREEVARLRERDGGRRRREAEADRLLGEQERLRDALETARRELRQLREEVERLKRDAEP
jgi:RNA polymerase sigma factor (sigma-70 family)